jgi:hypothetical protein
VAKFQENPVVVDAFDAPNSWKAIKSGLAQLQISSQPSGKGKALKLDFDFHGGKGFVVARKELPRRLPEAWEFRFRLKGEMPANRFEFKLIDTAGTSVWRWTDECLKPNGRWKTYKIPHSRMPFAWGPGGGGVPVEIGAIEFVIAAGNGGAGTLWIDQFEWVDSGPLLPEDCVASSGDTSDCLQASHGAWKPSPEDLQPFLEFDFGRKREIGGLILHWVNGSARDLAVDVEHDHGAWRPALELERVGGHCTPIPLPCPETRRIRLRFQPGAELAQIEWKGPEFSHSENEFLHTMAAESHVGAFPKYWLRRQTLVTPIGAPTGAPRGMMNEEGLIETDEAGFSLEPFLFSEGKLATWADVTCSRSMQDGWMPLPKIHWDAESLGLDIAAWTGRASTGRTLIASYTVENRSDVEREVRLHVAVRPFQATPPWQRHGHIGGKSPITAIEFHGPLCRVNGSRAVLALDPPSSTGTQPFVAGRLFGKLLANSPPAESHATDPLGLAEAVFTFDLTLKPGETATRKLMVPFGRIPVGEEVEPVTIAHTKAREEWAKSLCAVSFDVPPAWKDAAEAWRTAAAHILVNREVFALHPGPRRYNRAWIRDGVVMGAALARAGEFQAFPDFINWYAPWLRDDGQVPCCVDREGADWLVEYDSQGQWLYGIAECHRFGAGDAFALEHWPSVMNCVAHIRELRERRPETGYDMPDKRPFRGLLPESASHEGYLAHPVHAYWDDFWAIRGLRDVQALGEKLGRPHWEIEAIAALGNALTHSVTESLRATMELRNISYIPGSVEWADFDPAATAVALMILDGLGVLPEDGLETTFNRYLEGFRMRISGVMPWTNYSAYELRIVTALTRLGRRDEAIELLTFLLNDRRPKEWHQWPEITWKDPESPGHFGDLPHSWIGAEYVLGFAGLFAYEREADDALVLAAGLPADWFASGRTNGVNQLPTYYGRLSYSLKRSGERWELDLASLEKSPRGGVVVRLPISSATVLRAFGVDHPVLPDGTVKLTLA